MEFFDYSNKSAEAAPKVSVKQHTVRAVQLNSILYVLSS